MNKAILMLVGLIALVSCKGNEESTETGSDENVSICNYSYNEGTTTLEWVAFKTTDRKGVPGGFNDIEVTSDMSDDPKKVIESIQFSIKTASVETNDEGRNQKVTEHFFKTINTETINGKFKSLSDDGKATVEITMNGITLDVEGEYSIEDLTFNFKSMIDVGLWNGMSGIEALNAVCKDLHTGEDGVSKLWSEVELSLQTKLKSDCD